MLFLMVNEKTLFQAAQKDLRDEARDESRSGGVRVAVRWSDTIERNEVYEAFSAACLI
jgi:hypothetical protein